ncbi:MAG: Hpt domain-containing protein [Kordiimonadaceae bacterium]|nr:Hpt domain-containing protein [Kordiimonadaceae bacterium]
MPIIAVTGRISQHSEQEYRDAGLTAVIKKPVNTSNLMALLSQHLSTDDEARAIAEAKGLPVKDIFDVKELDQVNFATMAEYHSILEDDFLPLLDKYLAAGGDVLTEICDAISANNAEQVEFIAHKFKSTSLVFGAERVSNLAAQLEVMGRRNQLDKVGETFGELSWQFELAQELLEKKSEEMRSEQRR